jgi:diguanylate cyclase (GGDEF)-like protein
MIESRVVKFVVAFPILVAVYFVAGKLGLQLAYAYPSATPVWPPTGISLAGVLILGYRVLPAIFVGAFLVNVTTAGSVATSIGIGVGNTLEALVGAYLVNRFAGGRDTLAKTESLLRFTVLAAMVSTTVSATLGVTSLALGGFARWADFGSIWLTWWLGDMTGNLIVAPVLLTFSMRSQVPGQRGNAFEAAVLLGCLLFVGEVVFGGLFPSDIKNYPLEFLLPPFLLWAAFRFGQRGAATAILVLSGSAISGTLRGFGPFVRETPNESLLLLQAYMGVAAVTTLMLAAVVSEREEAAEQLHDLSMRDPLTGIANYRQLSDLLQAEIERSQRTTRSFALLFLDLDGLKEINDRYGHLVGNRALCRLVDVLRRSCRTIDTPARFGGDEFALVLPETDETAAWQVGRRISELLVSDGEMPPITVSLGVAIYPRNGETAEALLGAADHSLYEVKSRRR